MRVYVYVEGESDRLALEALFRRYRQVLKSRGHALTFIPSRDKAHLLHNIGHRAAEKLKASPEDRVAALPDLDTDNENELRANLRSSVRDALQKVYGYQGAALESASSRFYPSALKHEMEMLLLAAWRQLGSHIGAQLKPDWRQPVEEQNHTPQGRPKSRVQALFRTRSRKGHAYRQTTDAPAILRRVRDLRGDLMYSRSSQLECPVFKGFLDWLGKQTEVYPYDGPPSAEV